jgi:hypothetical protein
MYNANAYSRLPQRVSTINPPPTGIQDENLTRETAVQNRFSASMTAYCEAIMQQVHLQSTTSLTSTVEGLLELRRDSIATTPIYALIEYVIIC